MSIRHLAEKFSRTFIFKRRLPEEFGRVELYVTPGAALKYWNINLSNIDPMLLRIAKQYISTGYNVWDIGANVGLFSVAAAYQAGKKGSVLSIEADTWLVGLLRRTSIINKHNMTIKVLPVAVSDTVGIDTFSIAERGRAASALKNVPESTQMGGIRETQLVPTVSLDWLLDYFPSPDFIKIDVEGAELKVLIGAEKILTNIRPVILCEINKQNISEVTKLLSTHGYKFYDAEKELPEDNEVMSGVYNTLAIFKS